MRFKRFVSLILVCILLCGTFAGTAAAAVAMPAGVTESRIAAAMPKMDSLVKGVLKNTGDKQDINALVYGMLFSDHTLNAVFSGVYSSFSDQANTLSTLGVDISVSGVSACLGAYPDVQAALAGKDSWDAVFASGFAPKWNVTTKDGFGAALAAIFTPLNDLLFTLLCSGSYTPNLLITIRGADGYQNAVVPILDTIGTPGIMTQKDFTAAARADRSMMLKNIASMLCAAVDNLLLAPVASLCQYLPGIADYLVSGGLQASMTTLVEPLRVRVGVISLSGVDQLLENLGDFSDSADLTARIENMDTSALFGSDVDLTLPKIDLEGLAACGGKQDGKYVSQPEQAFVLVFRWAVEALKLNADRLPQMLGDGAAGAQAFINKLLSKSADELLVMVLELLELQPQDSVLQYRWTYPGYTPGTVEYTPNLTREDYVRVLAGIDSTLNEFMSEFTENGTLSGMLAARIYSNSLVSKLVTSVYGALDTEQTGPLLALLGLDASPWGLADSIASACPGAAGVLRNYDTWAQVPASRLSWGFTNGSKEGFTRALTAVLTPFRPFLTLLLAEGKLTLFDTVTLGGSNGYDTAVIPLLEALGCPQDSIKTYVQYQSTAASNAAVTDILTPVTALLDRLIEAPVATLCEILPNLIYFINGNGLNQCVQNLVYPVRVLLQKLDAEALLADELGKLGNIDLETMVPSLMADAGLDIKLPAPDLTLLASLGTPETRVSKRTYNGTPENYIYISADQPAVLLTVLRYVVGALGSEENASTLSALFQQDQSSEGDMMAMYTGKVAEQLKTMTTDETIEWLYDLLFAETPKKAPDTSASAEIPHIYYKATEKHTARNATAIGVVSMLLLAALILVLSRVDFTAWHERRQHMKLKRKNAIAAAKAGVSPSASADAKLGPGESPAGEQPPAAQPKYGMTEKERIRHEKELIKMRVREEKARQKAYRQTKKADKYYEQALRQQKKKQR